MYKDNKTSIRNIQEQVLENSRLINDILYARKLLNEFGIKVVGAVETANDLPNPQTYSGSYGDAYAVGTTTPYELYIFTRPFEGDEYPHWFNIGPFPVPGPQGEQGEQGEQGIQGNPGMPFLSGSGNPAISLITQDGQSYIDASTGDVYKATLGNPSYWTRVGTIRGPQGPQGPQGPVGPQGPQGIQGEEGPRGSVVNIRGNLASVENLPSPQSQGFDFHNAYLVGSNPPHLYIIEGNPNDQSTWLWYDAGAFTSGGEYTKVSDANGSYIANITADNTPAQGRVPVYDASGNIKSGTPQNSTDVANKDYVDSASGNVYVYNGQLRNNKTYAELYNALYNNGNPIKTLQVENGIYTERYFRDGPIQSGVSTYNNLYYNKTFLFKSILSNNYLIYEAVINNVSLEDAEASDDSSYYIKYVQKVSVEITIPSSGRINIKEYPTLLAVNLLDTLQRRQLKDIVVSFTNVSLTNNTATLTITSSQWTKLKDDSSRNVKVSIGLTNGITIVLDRVGTDTNYVRFGGNIGSTQYYATFINNNGTYSGEFGTLDFKDLFGGIIIGSSFELNKLATDLNISLDTFYKVITEDNETSSGAVASMIGEELEKAILKYPLQITIVRVNETTPYAQGNAFYKVYPSNGNFDIGDNNNAALITETSVREDVLGVGAIPKYVLILRGQVLD